MFNATDFEMGAPAHNAPGTHGLGTDAFHEQNTAAFCSTPPTLRWGTPLTTLLRHAVSKHSSDSQVLKILVGAVEHVEIRIPVYSIDFCSVCELPE